MDSESKANDPTKKSAGNGEGGATVDQPTPSGDGTTPQHGSDTTLLTSNKSNKPATSPIGPVQGNQDDNQGKDSSEQQQKNPEQQIGHGTGPIKNKDFQLDEEVTVIGTKVDLTEAEKDILQENSGLHRSPLPGEGNSFSWLAEPGLPYLRNGDEIQKDREVNHSAQTALRKYMLYPPHRLAEHNRSLTRFGFGENSWYFHCSVLTQLASDSSVTLPAAQDRAQHVCSKLSSIDIMSDLERFYQLASIAQIKKLKQLDVITRVHLVMTWGTYSDHLGACQTGEADRSLHTSMQKFSDPMSISGQVQDLMDELKEEVSFEDLVNAQASAPSAPALASASARSINVSSSDASNFEYRALMKDFTAFSSYIKDSDPTWTHVKQAFVSCLFSNFVFSELSKALEQNDIGAARAFQARTSASPYKGMYSYRLDILKENISQVLCKIKSHVSPSEIKSLDFVDYFLAWKSAFTGDRENISRCIKTEIELFSLDINSGVEKTMTRFFELKKKLGDDWKATPTLPGAIPNWFNIYAFLFKEITLASLHPVFQTFNEEFFKFTNVELQVAYLEAFVLKLAKNAKNYDAHVNPAVTAYDTRRTTGNDIVFNSKSSITQWSSWVHSRRLSPIPFHVWKKMTPSLQERFIADRKSKGNDFRPPTLKQKKRSADGTKKGGEQKVDWSKHDLKTLADYVKKLNKKDDDDQAGPGGPTNVGSALPGL